MPETENIIPVVPAPDSVDSSIPSGSDRIGGDSSTGDMADGQVGTPKVGGVSPSVIPITPSPHKKIPTLLLFLIPILVVAAVISIYVMLQARKMYQESVVAPSPTSSPVASADPTANWQSYKNDEMKISLKYPTSWYLYEPDGTPFTVGFWVEKSEGEASGVWLYVIDNPTNLSPKDWWEKEIKETPTTYAQWMSTTTRKDIKVADTDAFFIQTSRDWESRPFTSVYINKDRKIYHFTTNFTSENQLAIFDQILSTFKFVSTPVNADLEKVIKDLVYDYGKSHGITNKDQIIIKINKISGDYAYGTTSFVESVEGSGNIWYATYLDGHWTQIWAGQEPPTCDSLSEWPYPAGFFECTK